MDIGQVIGKVIELRDRKDALKKKQSEEMAPLNDAMEKLENYLMHQMNESGVDQLKANGVGTAFRSTTSSVKLEDDAKFKEFVFFPAMKGVVNFLNSVGLAAEITPHDEVKILDIIRDMADWDVVDFRAGKKGVQEHLENEKTPVPGVSISTIATINVRRA